MSQPTIELKISTDIYERAGQIARETNRSIEAVLQDSLTLLFSDISEMQITPEDLDKYSDTELWAIVYQRLTWYDDKNLRELITLGKQQTLTDDQQSALEHLLDQVDHQMLLRSEALLLLKKRGHDVETHLKIGA